MTPKEILLAAAQRIEDGKDTYCCIAIKNVTGYYQDSPEDDKPWELCQHACSVAFDRFEALNRPRNRHEEGVWFSGGSFEDRQQARTEALRHAASTFN